MAQCVDEHEVLTAEAASPPDASDWSRPAERAAFGARDGRGARPLDGRCPSPLGYDIPLALKRGYQSNATLGEFAYWLI